MHNLLFFLLKHSTSKEHEQWHCVNIVIGKNIVHILHELIYNQPPLANILSVWPTGCTLHVACIDQQYK